MTGKITCPVCGAQHNDSYAFCTECGTNLTEIDAVSVKINPDTSEEKTSGTLIHQVHSIGQKAQQGISGVSNLISGRAKDVTSKATNVVVEQKVAEAMGSLVNLMINVSKDILHQIPSDMVSAVDLEAEVNFVAFTIGVSIDLAEVQAIKKAQQINDV